MSQLPADCLTEIFEYFEYDNVTLRSCLLVNRLWCKISVRILWRDDSNWNYGTLISCLTNESKEILNEKEIIITTTTSKSPVFNYASFCKSLTIFRVNYSIERLLKNQPSIQLRDLEESKYIVTQEIYKLLMSQIPSLKSIRAIAFYWSDLNIDFTSYPGAKDCLKNLTELNCHSNIYPELFHKLSKVCHNIQNLYVSIQGVIPDELKHLISVQQNLKQLNMSQYNGYKCFSDIVPSITKPNTLIKLKIYDLNKNSIPLSFIIRFTNLQELELSSNHNIFFEDFKRLQYHNFNQLQILNFKYLCPNNDLLINFLENNGNNLKELYVGNNKNTVTNSLNLSISNYCTNLRKLSTGFKIDELESLKRIFNNCQYLESIRIWCGKQFLKMKEVLELVVNHSPKNFYELKLNCLYNVGSELSESFFKSWIDYKPKRILTLMIINYDANSLRVNYENIEMIRKYIKLGVVKFKVKHYNDDV